MNDKYVMLISRQRNNSKELLFIRLSGRTLLQLPLAISKGKELKRRAIERTTLANFDSTVSHIKKVTSCGYQTPGAVYTSLQMYSVELTRAPRTSPLYENIIWLNKDQVDGRSAQMSVVMQDYVLPSLADAGFWI